MHPQLFHLLFADNAGDNILAVAVSQLVARIDALSTEIPAQVRPLYQLWRDGQALQLQLAEERQRYSKLQQSSDSELDTLRQQHHVLQQQLELTTRTHMNSTIIYRKKV